MGNLFLKKQKLLVTTSICEMHRYYVWDVLLAGFLLKLKAEQ
jgi:hypothetical protein